MEYMDINLQDVTPAMLPESLALLSDLVGIRNTLKLTENFPGVSLYIPRKAKEHHPIAKVMGQDVFKKLIESYSGEAIKIAKPDSIYRKLKHLEVKKLKAQGLPNREIAVQLNYSQRHIERVLREYV